MCIASYGKIPNKYWNHDPKKYDIFGSTVAVYLEKNGLKVPS